MNFSIYNKVANMLISIMYVYHITWRFPYTINLNNLDKLAFGVVYESIIMYGLDFGQIELQLLISTTVWWVITYRYDNA